MRRHLTILLTGPSATLLESWRRTWDPVMAAVVPAHVTLLYPEEVLIQELRDEGQATEAMLLEPRQVEEVVAETAPFRLRLGAVITLDEGHGGVFVAVQDVDGGWAHLRHRLLSLASGTAPGTTPDLTAGFPPHATIAHPRTSSQCPECWSACRGRSLSGEFTVTEIAHTTTAAEAFTVEQRYPLLGSRVGPPGE
jgi:hypothetical protein